MTGFLALVACCLVLQIGCDWVHAIVGGCSVRATFCEVQSLALPIDMLIRSIGLQQQKER